ncbi:hypothetical protein KUTeg_019802 [Tegillarca granosa]|uniref:Metallo-beta-lactamase domain-containing protein n=1 Tax=Tegillarca granosa TaxID=220873 RepID=A0ABQ9EG59_TEGGR|nr:hypothetical protein KUTeg_019802 [Tegillarca granosa]
MELPTGTLYILIIAVIFYCGVQIWSGTKPSYSERILRIAKASDEELSNHSNEFNKPEIIKVTDGIYVAIGFALANSIMIEGNDSIVIVDVTESTESATEIFAAFRNITSKPVAAIIYTHNHADHTYGAQAFIEDINHPPDIWAHVGILKQFQRVFSTVNTATYKRAARQFGVLLPNTINAGIGHRLRYSVSGDRLGVVFPDKFVSEKETEVHIAGMDMAIIHIPGETDDQIGVWIPERQVFLCADDVYRAFPNLYAIRGTPSRDLQQWVGSIDTIIAYKPEFLVPSHTRPVSGQQNILNILIPYRDAIQYIHDQTVRYINKGYQPDEIAEMVKLPSTVAEHPYLKEFYGTVQWSVKGVFTSYLGWFSGNPVDLQPLTPKVKAEKMLKLVGRDKLVESAKEAYNNKDYQWALELSSYIVLMDKGHTEALNIKIDSLASLGAGHKSACGRNYYLTSAFEEASELILKRPESAKQKGIQILPIMQLFNALPSRFKPEDCENLNETVLFQFTDSGLEILLQIRNSVAVITENRSDNYEYGVKLSIREDVFREIMQSKLRALTAYGRGELKVDSGGLMKFRSVMSCFEQD